MTGTDSLARAKLGLLRADASYDVASLCERYGASNNSSKTQDALGH